MVLEMAISHYLIGDFKRTYDLLEALNVGTKAFFYLNEAKAIGGQMLGWLDGNREQFTDYIPECEGRNAAKHFPGLIFC